MVGWVKEEVVVAVVQSCSVGRGDSGGLLARLAFLLFFTSILDPLELKGVKTEGGVWFLRQPKSDTSQPNH